MCTCGETTEHEVMRRRTADGLGLLLWSTGGVTNTFGQSVSGVPVRRPRTQASLDLALRSGRLFVDAAQLHDRADLGLLFTASERAARGDGLPGTVRRLFREAQQRAARPLLTWTITAADARGKVMERQCRLPRLGRYAGLCVIDFCGGRDSSGGRYEVYRISRDPTGRSAEREVLEPTGFRAKNLDELWRVLDLICARVVERV